MTAVDPTSGLVALAGCVATMDDAGTIIRRGVVYVRDDTIVQVSAHDAPAPDGFADIPVVDTGGTLFPGLIELHNHLPYDVLSLWQVPKKYTNRDQWSSSSTKDYHRLISGPMGVLGRNPDVVPAVVRYVEVRALLGGTTTSQGVALAVDPGIVKLYRGLVRNVESTGDPALPVASTRIADVDATDAERFLARLSGTQKLLLHLSEGTDTKARQHFLALKMSDQRWAITPNLIGIHCAALTAADFAVLAAHGGSMVWSPLSNLLLYGQTADLGAALSAGVPVALGSDWAPSGSRNLLGELKIARLAAPLAGADISDRDMVAMATRTPATLLGWDKEVGSLEAGKRGDLIVVHGKTGDPYRRLLDADEADLDLVMINGIARSGSTAVMRNLGMTGERVRVGHHDKILNLTQPDADPTVGAITVAAAIDRLTDALADLPNTPAPARAGFAPDRVEDRPLLAVEGVIDNAMSPRPHLPYRGRLTGPNLPRAWAGRTTTASASAAVGPLPALVLDPLTVAGDPGYHQTLAAEPNLPPDITAGLG